jgi:hypothetical protein
MLSGFNTNFRYRGVLFHVQTEDSGLDNPHVITHLFHGGNIMVTVKQDYSDLLQSDGIEGSVKEMMEGQHKKILKQLSRGEHDGVICERLGADIFLAEKEVGAESLRAPSVTEEEPPSAGAAALGLTKKPAPAPSTARAPGTLPPVAMAQPGARAQAPLPSPPQPETTTALSRVFGDRVVSEKPLDEVVLDYLVENARKRRRQPK